MTADRWTQEVRHLLRLGRLLPLGLPHDGSWITESAAGSVLRRAADPVREVRLGTLRISLADPEQQVHEPVVPPPPSALPPGPLRIIAEFTVSADPTAPGVDPLPTTADRLRLALAAAAEERLGLMVTEVDLLVTELSNGADEAPVAVRPDDERPTAQPTGADELRAASAALSVPGVARLTDALGRPVHIEDVVDGKTTLPHRHVRVEVAVTAERRTADVARAVRSAVTEALPDHPSVAVVVTAVGRP